MDFYLFFIYFFAGIVTFFASCAFILVPPFLGVISGSLAASRDMSDKRLPILKNAIFYVLGFSFVFILLGIGLGFAGKVLFFKEIIQRLGGVILVVLGLVMFGVFKHSFFSKKLSLNIPQKMQNRGVVTSFLLGSVFAAGWSPCTGPLLGSILVLTSYGDTLFKGVAFLSAFSLGVALPFLFSALFFSQFSKFFEKSERVVNGIMKFSAIFLIVVGLLIASNRFYNVVEYLF